MLSGYSEKFRLDTIQSAVRGYENQCAAADAGIKPLHRPREFQSEERRKNKLLSKTSWYRPASEADHVLNSNSELYKLEMRNFSNMKILNSLF